MFVKTLRLVSALFALSLLGASACDSSEPASDSSTTGDEDDLKARAHCGGLAGLKCKSGYTCIDDPSDSCDPAKGGADCIGLCVKPTKKTCADLKCDAGLHCEMKGLNGGSIPVCVQGGMCGGIAGIACPDGQACVDDPSDSCDPAKGGADCPGVCQAAPAGKTCGGLAGISCAKDEYCDFPEGVVCGAGDQTGTCKKRPTSCPTGCPAPQYSHCGCDGKAYCSDCDAFKAGTDVSGKLGKCN